MFSTLDPEPEAKSIIFLVFNRKGLYKITNNEIKFGK